MGNIIVDRCRLCSKFTDLDPFSRLCIGCFVQYYSPFAKHSKKAWTTKKLKHGIRVTLQEQKPKYLNTH
jgi:hypothetical protein